MGLPPRRPLRVGLLAPLGPGMTAEGLGRPVQGGPACITFCPADDHYVSPYGDKPGDDPREA